MTDGTPDKKVAADNRTVLSISDACGLVSKVIAMNNIAIESMKVEMEFNKKVAKFRLHENRIVRAKTTLVNKLNELFEMQLHEFTDERQKQTAEIYSMINLHDENAEAKTMIEEIRRLEEIKSRLQNQFAQLAEQIPDRRLIVNYKIRPPKAKDQSCAEAAQDYYGEAEVDIDEDEL